MRKIAVLLNARAGAMLDYGSDVVRAALDDVVGAKEQVDVALVKPRRMRPALREAAAADYDTIVVGGGDGSVSFAVGLLAGSGKTLGVLPFGTLNLFARDLGMPVTPREAVAALARAHPRRVDLASLNGRLFHSLSGFGFFSQMARAREEARDLPGKLMRVGVAATRAFARTGRFALQVEIDGETRSVDSYAVLVTCNRFSGTDWRRDTLHDGELEIHFAKDEGGLSRLKAAAGMLTGGWRENPGIVSMTSRDIRILSTRPRAWVATDGELARERTPLHYKIHPGALSVLAPA